MTKTTLKWVLIIAYIIALFFVPKMLKLLMIIAPVAILIIRSAFFPNKDVQKLEDLKSRDELGDKEIDKLGTDVIDNLERMQRMIGDVSNNYEIDSLDSMAAANLMYDIIIGRLIRNEYFEAKSTYFHSDSEERQMKHAEIIVSMSNNLKNQFSSHISEGKTGVRILFMSSMDMGEKQVLVLNKNE